MDTVVVQIQGQGAWRVPADQANYFIICRLEAYGNDDVFLHNGHHTWAPCGGDTFARLDSWMLWE